MPTLESRKEEVRRSEKSEKLRIKVTVQKKIVGKEEKGILFEVIAELVGEEKI